MIKILAAVIGTIVLILSMAAVVTAGGYIVVSLSDRFKEKLNSRIEMLIKEVG